jgi:hypothetical protein
MLHDIKMECGVLSVLGRSSVQHFTMKPWTQTDALGIFWNHFWTCDMMKDSMASVNKTMLLHILTALWEVFNKRIITAGLLASRLLNLSVCDFYLWGNLKGKLYRNTLRTAEALQNDIRNVVSSISAQELQHIAQGFLRRCKGCLRGVSNHFRNIWQLSFSFYLSVSCTTWTDGFKPQNEGRYFSTGSEQSFVSTSSGTDKLELAEGTRGKVE